MKKLKDLLKESYVWERKFGEKLPTLADVQKKKNEQKLSEGKWKIKGKYLAVDGGYTSIPGAYDNDAVVISIKNDTFNLHRGRTGYYVAGNRYDKSFKNDKELVNWLNKEKAKYQGIDKR